MQFLWRYIDDFIGKGLGFGVVAELMFYATINLVPMALPLAILLSSIMTFGALGESNELTAMKSSGMSLFKVMKPITVFIFLIATGAFLFANYTWPWSNLKWKTLYWEILESKPAFRINEKVFYNEIPNFSIRVERKEKDGRKFEDVIIYDYTGEFGYRKRDVRSSTGEIQQSKNPGFMALHLENGIIYEEITDTKKLKGAVFPFRTTQFKEADLKFDVSGFQLSRGNEDLFKDSYEMLNIFQINTVTDSLRKTRKERSDDYLHMVMNKHLIFRAPLNMITRKKIEHDSLMDLKIKLINQKADPGQVVTLTPTIVSPGQNKYETALELCRSSIQVLDNNILEMRMRDESLIRYEIEWHRKFTLPLACIVIFFIGAPLGAIVKKGGLGMPMVISVLLFLLYHILNMSGEKMAKSGTVDPAIGMWFSAMILAPIGLFITWLAVRESNLTTFGTRIGSGLKLRKRKP